MALAPKEKGMRGPHVVVHFSRFFPFTICFCWAPLFEPYPRVFHSEVQEDEWQKSYKLRTLG